MASLHVKKGDRVKVITGKDKGVIAEVIAVDPASERVTVQGVNLVKKHRRESQTAAGRKVDLALRAEKPKRFFGRVGRGNVAEAIFLGPDDVASGAARLKNLRDRSERKLLLLDPLAPLPA